MVNDPQDALARLIQALKVLPGVGPKSAQRIAFHLLQHDRSGAQLLGQSLLDAVQTMQHCQQCNTFSETPVCTTCADGRRDPSILCVVETPADQLMVEQTLTYKGLYFVLMGRLSPLDGLGPDEIHLHRLLARIDQSQGVIQEVVLATNFTSEREYRDWETRG